MNDISVIVSTYNQGGVIKKALDSVFNKQDSLFLKEVIVSDDQSNDGTEAIIKNINNIKYIRSEHSGLPSKTRNAGVLVATGKYIAFLDGDDVWKENKIKIQLAYLKENNFQICAANASVVRSGKNEGSLLKNPPRVATFGDLLRTNWVIMSSVLLESDLLKQVGYFPVDPKYKAYEDYVLWLRIATITDLGILNKDLVIYKDDPGESVRKDQLPFDRMSKEIKFGIIPWGIRNFFRHPNKPRLLICMYTTIMYLLERKFNEKMASL